MLKATPSPYKTASFSGSSRPLVTFVESQSHRRHEPSCTEGDCSTSGSSHEHSRSTKSLISNTPSTHSAQIGDGQVRDFGRHDQVESFGLLLVLKDGFEYPLCAFQGEGAAHTGWVGVLLGDDSLIDFAGTQESDSRQAARALAKLIGVSLGKQYITDEAFVRCPHCDHPTARTNRKCLYCGKITNTEPVARSHSPRS